MPHTPTAPNPAPQPTPRDVWEQTYPESIRAYEVDPDRVSGALHALCEQGSAVHGDKVALSFILPQGAQTSLSFREVDALSTQLARYFVHEAGMQAGDVVAIQLPNSLHHAITAFAAWKAGLIVTNVNPLYTPREVLHQLRDSSAQILVASDLFAPQAHAAASDLGIPVLLTSLADFFEPAAAGFIRQLLAQSAPAAPDFAHVRFTDALARGMAHDGLPDRAHPVALYQYTGGTTGLSKGAVITHRQMLTVLAQTQDYLRAFDVRMGADDTVLTVIPMYHIFAFALNFLLFYKLGARNVLVPNPRPLSNVRAAFEFCDVTWMTGVDTLYAGLLNEPWFKDVPRSLKFAISGGTALRPSTARQWEDTVCPIVEGYGLTETCCVVAFNPPGPKMKIGTVGLPVPGLGVRIVGAEGRDVDIGEPGELWVRGDSVIQAYLNRPDESASAFEGGWFKTGDVVAMDPEGYIRIVDRKKDMINVSGFNVYPNEVEAVIAALPAVAEVAVVGVATDDAVEVVKAVIVRRDAALTADAVLAHCRGELTAYKVPRIVEFVDGLPKSPVGKILRNQLR